MLGTFYVPPFKINLYTQDLDIQKEKNLELIYTGEGGSDSDRALANKYLKILEYIRILQDNEKLFESAEAYILDKKLEETFKLGKVY